jgi:hypothetical protein
LSSSAASAVAAAAGGDDRLDDVNRGMKRQNPEARSASLTALARLAAAPAGTVRAALANARAAKSGTAA